jgi:rubrerythrin
MVNISVKKLKFYIADEKKANREYRHYGFYNLAKDEAKHRRFLQLMLRKKLRKVI